MKDAFDLATITAGQRQPLALFAVTSLGMIESLLAGTVTPTEATSAFFHGRNIRFAKVKLRDSRAMELLGRGVQLADLFDALPVEEAHREFQHVLQAMKSLCMQMLVSERAVA